MKRVFNGPIGYEFDTNSQIVRDVEYVLKRNNFKVDVYGVFSEDGLGNNYEIVDFDSRDTLALSRDGKLLNDEEMNLEHAVSILSCIPDYPEVMIRRNLNDPVLRTAIFDCDWDRAVSRLGELLAMEEENSRWIPCENDHMPDEGDDVLVTVFFEGLKIRHKNGWDDSIPASTYVIQAVYEDNRFKFCNEDTIIARDKHKVLAWMPLPKPWTGRRCIGGDDSVDEVSK